MHRKKVRKYTTKSNKGEGYEHVYTGEVTRIIGNMQYQVSIIYNDTKILVTAVVEGKSIYRQYRVYIGRKVTVGSINNKFFIIV